MTHTKLPVVAAIPNYNMASSLDRLLKQVTKQDYAKIYVLDDASTDNSADVVSKYPDVTFISAPRNKGANAARNMVLKELKQPSIIHYLDADSTLESDAIVEKIQQLDFTNTGFIGGLLLNEAGEIYEWNYGPPVSLRAAVTAIIYSFVVKIKNPRRRTKMLRHFTQFPASQQPNPKPYWVIESNLMILSETLKQFGGFEESIREHDIIPTAERTYKAGLINRHTRTVVAMRHDEINVRKGNRELLRLRTIARITHQQIGWRHWLFRK